ncbi:hypothetical protein HXX02_06590 [Microbulbifer elongatus]|uniref:DUF3325 domain-containing protein n=1 Tax=Microbulbifer elongatus TaxID=86173 RepID=A0ABT1NYZ9_9GAMM|nr:hypothetical protein [Microbulbifer elongatus]MCQ3829106.1 hypothetical protein [Microbulbifer elongatus]
MLILLTTSLIAGATLLYLCHRHQGWLMQPLSGSWRWLGWFLVAGTLALACWVYPINTAILAWMVGLMLLWGALPFVPLIRQRQQGGEHER